MGPRKLLVQLLGTSFGWLAQGSVVLLYLLHVLRADCRLSRLELLGCEGRGSGALVDGRLVAKALRVKPEPLGAAFQFAERCLLRGQRGAQIGDVAERLHLGLGQSRLRVCPASGCAAHRRPYAARRCRP